MKARRLLTDLCVAVLFLAAASPALAQRSFVSAKTGSDGNPCTLLSPCRSFGTAIAAVGAGGEVVALDSGGYGPVTITKAITIESPGGIYAGIAVTSGDAITINAGSSDKVTLRGLTLNAGPGDGIRVNSIGTLTVENCFIAGYTNDGISMPGTGQLLVKGTDIKNCFIGIDIWNGSGTVLASVDHCHLDGNVIGFFSSTSSPGLSKTTATFSTANLNSNSGWVSGNASTGPDVLNLEFCSGSGNDGYGLSGGSTSGAVRYANCIFSNNLTYGVGQFYSCTVQSRGNNTITGNGTAPTNGTIGSFSPM